ncbi:MAG TPA: hypothetical protein VFJ30_15235 [Phycisphaerae bacterium]|nr:hypothetical protein [Phycisphaerae bacterium]
MTARNWALRAAPSGIVLLALSCLAGQADKTTDGTNPQSKETKVLVTWRTIQEAAAALDAAPSAELPARTDAATRSIAQGADRSSIEELVKNIGTPLGLKDGSVRIQSLHLAGRVIAAIADPKGEHGLKSAAEGLQGRIGSGGRMSWYGLVTAAIDTYRDAAAEDLLLWIALESHKALPAEVLANEPPYIHALGYLRTYTPAHVRAKLEAALRDHVKEESLRSNGEGRRGSIMEAYLGVRREPAMYLRAALASLDFSASLKSPAERSRYHDFERRLWRAWGLAKRGSRMIGMEFILAAEVLNKSWKKGDERFVLRIFEEPSVTPEELHIAVDLAWHLPAVGQDKLREIAAGQGPKARYAKKALDLIARKAKRDAIRAKREATQEKSEADRKPSSQPASPAPAKP